MPKRLLYLLFFLSGAAGLGYQLIWARLFALGLGHELPAILGVLTAFMFGLAIGAWISDRPFLSQPNRNYALLELIIGVWAIVTALVIIPGNEVALRFIGLDSTGRHWFVSFLYPLIVLLPATTAMGATFPAMERWISALTKSGRNISAIYAVNTFGAVVGTFSSIFFIAPHLGFHATLFVLATINLLCSIIAFCLPSPESQVLNPNLRSERSGLRIKTTLALTGLLGIGLEIVVVRTLSQVLANTVYTYASVLAVFLLGTSLGAALHNRFCRVTGPKTLNALLCGLMWSCFFGLVTLRFAPSIHEALRSLIGTSISGMIVVELLTATSVLLLPTAFMGATFSELVQSWRDAKPAVGRAVAINTLGAALAPLLFNLFLLPSVGSRWTLVAIAVGYGLLLAKPAFRTLAAAIVAAALMIVLPLRLQIIDLPEAGRLLDYREGRMATMAVVEDATRNRTLRVNNHFQMGGTGAADAEYRHAHMPLLLHPDPRRVLVLGTGTGITTGGALVHSNLVVDSVELLPELLATLPEFEPWNHSPQTHPAARLHAADARRFVKLATNRYDVVIADLFHPSQEGAGSLYTREHFSAIRQTLTTNGLFCQWLPLHQLDEPTLKSIIRTFSSVFPECQAYLLRFNVDAPVLGLIGFCAPLNYGSRWVEQRLAHSSAAPEIKRLALADSIRFFGNLVAGSADLVAYSQNSPLNSDDHPVVTFQAPRFAYSRKGNSYDRLLRLLEQIKPDPAAALHLDGSEQEFAAKLRSYFTARNAYIQGLVAQATKREDEAIEKFIESASLSPDFTPGYAQCLSLASLQARDNPEKARTLLERLAKAQPDRPVAHEMLKRLFP